MENCPMDVPAANVNMTGFKMCTLLMCVVSGKIADENNYSHDCVPINPKKLVKELKELKQNSKVVQKLPLGSSEPTRKGFAYQRTKINVRY